MAEAIAVVSKGDTTKHTTIWILVFVLVIIIVYTIVMFEMYKRGEFIFSPYVPKPAPPNSFYPLGTITPLTQEQINHRNDIIRASIAK
jgi:flagellar basal body-associated protein FliL